MIWINQSVSLTPAFKALLIMQVTITTLALEFWKLHPFKSQFQY